MLYLWVAVMVATIVMEALTSDLVTIWFLPAAIVSMILSLAEVKAWVQIVLFLVIGLALLIATRPLCRKFLASRSEKTNVDAIIGRTCIVTEEIRNIDEQGEVKVGGLRWSARSANDAVIPVDTRVRVLEIQGVKLIVEPIENSF